MIHYNIPSKSEALYYEVIKTLPEKVSPYPGFDAASLYSVIKALGPSFIHGTEKYNAKDGINYIYIKNANREMKKDEYRMILRINPYPHTFCICYHNNVPYRAQIIAQSTSTKINVERVDVGEFLTVTIDKLKVSEPDELSKVPRFAIPCKIVNDKKPNLRISLDGFERRSTNKCSNVFNAKE
uniref:Tudor domain-containing protein n=1 Tax=Panagrolaimus davidi TaxID=227884 RepID=A0A914P8V1_9BILA